MRSTPPRSMLAEPEKSSERELLCAPSAAAHQVQFYEDDAFLITAVVDFLAAGLTVGQPLVVIATPSHRDAFAGQLAAEGFDVDAASRRGRLTWLDARDTLALFMAGAEPDPERFTASLGALLGAHRLGSGRPAIRLYGEMVDVLWKDGNTDGALRVEELWNGLAETHEFSLLCAYAMGNFYKATDAERFEAICRHHTRVVPTERYMQADESQRLLEVSALQQRASALEAEIAHRQTLEHELRRREAELRALLAERDGLLAAERCAREDAEAASRAKSEFLAMMSHELRTPLNAIGGHLQLIEMGIHGPVSDAQREALARAERGQRHLLAIINDLLNLTRIESGQIAYVLEDVALPPLVSDTMSMLEPLLTSRQLTCGVANGPCEHDVGAPIARADREKTQQIVINLLTNAIKFTPAFGRITIDLSEADAVPRMLRLRVRDTGIGIAAPQLERIFEPFVQLGRTQPMRQDGVGLGLAISRDLARGMGGDLFAESAVGEGTTFTLLLPSVTAE